MINLIQYIFWRSGTCSFPAEDTTCIGSREGRGVECVQHRTAQRERDEGTCTSARVW